MSPEPEASSDDVVEWVNHTKLSAAIRAWIVVKQFTDRGAELVSLPTISEEEYAAQHRMLKAHAMVSERVRRRILAGDLHASPKEEARCACGVTGAATIHRWNCASRRQTSSR